MMSCIRHPTGPYPGCPACEDAAHGRPYPSFPSAGPVRVVPCLLPFGEQLAHAGSIMQLRATPQTSFVGEWLVIPKRAGQYLRVLDCQVGNRCLYAAGGEVDALCFRETLTEKNRIRLDWGKIRMSEHVVVRVVNIHTEPVKVTAHLLGAIAVQ